MISQHWPDNGAPVEMKPGMPDGKVVRAAESANADTLLPSTRNARPVQADVKPFPFVPNPLTIAE